MRGQRQRHDALLGHADQRNWLVETLHYSVCYERAFIHHEVESDRTRGQLRGDLFGAAIAADFLVVAGHHVDRLFRPKALGQQSFDGLQYGQQVALVVPGTAPPDVAILDGAREGIDRPIFLSAFGDGDHILVRHQHERFGLRIAALPGEEQVVASHQFALERTVYQWKRVLQMLMQLEEFGRGMVRLAVERYCAQPHCRGQPFGCG
ncbi:hypothetical protein D9M70_435930 [compost metagenome]